MRYHQFVADNGRRNGSYDKYKPAVIMIVVGLIAMVNLHTHLGFYISGLFDGIVNG